MKLSLGIPIVVEKVRVQGPEAVREVDLILDTGARFVSSSWDTLKDVGYDPAVAEQRVRILTANGLIEAPLLRIQRICVEDLCVEDVEVIALTIPELAEVDGLLGLSFLFKFRTTIDCKSRALEIE